MKSTCIQFDALETVSVVTENVDSENLQPQEVLIQTEASLVSAGTELARLRGEEDDGGFPYRPGYACVGKIVAAGAALENFKTGDRVFFAGKHASLQIFEQGQDHQWGRLYAVPEKISAKEAVFVCLAQIASVAPLTSVVEAGETVAVFGMGVIGNLAAQQYQLGGARVVGLDPLGPRAELARRCGISTVVDCAAGEQLQQFREIAPELAQISVDAVGHSAVIQNCVQVTRDFGDVVLLGTPRRPFQTDVTPMLQDVHMRGLAIRGAHMWRFPAMDIRGVKHSVESQYKKIFEWIAAGSLSIAPLISHCVGVSRAKEMYRGLLNDPEDYWGIVFTYDAP